MRSVIEAAEAEAGGHRIDTTDGVRVIRDDGSWVLVLPAAAEPVTDLWAEAGDVDGAQALIERWARIVEQAAG
jgi:mannose-1-phosphate guanylyltransferase/phosphomannomutase